jgi:hypothetical protein
MNKVLSLARRGLKIAAYSAIGLSVAGFGYLQYINSVIGPIGIEKGEATSYY